MKAWSGMWGRLARHQGTLSTSAHAEHGHDKAMVSPCYPDEGCFLWPWMAASCFLDDPQMGQVLKGRGVRPTMRFRWQPLKRGVASL